jgi:hypothetical protein
MKARDLVRKQCDKHNWWTLFWFALFGGCVLVLALCELLWVTWLPLAGCAIGLFVTAKLWSPKCPFCLKTSISIQYDKIGNFCESCGESFDRQLAMKPDAEKATQIGG